MAKILNQPNLKVFGKHVLRDPKTSTMEKMKYKSWSLKKLKIWNKTPEHKSRKGCMNTRQKINSGF